MNPGGETERALNRDLGKMLRPAEQRQPLFAAPVRLSGAVGNNRDNQSADVKQVQRTLGGLGLASESKLYEPSGILDRETLDTLQLFQKASDLRVDGYMNPGGETEAAMNAALQRLSAPSPTEDDEENEGEDEKEEEDEENEDENEPDCTDQEQALEDAEEELRLAQEALDEAIAHLEELKKELEALDRNPKDNQYCIDLHKEHDRLANKLSTEIPNQIMLEKNNINRDQQDLQELRAQLLLAMIPSLSAPRSNKKGPPIGLDDALDIANISNKQKYISKIQKQIDDLQASILGSERKIERLEKEAEETREQIKDREEEISLNCPNFYD